MNFHCLLGKHPWAGCKCSVCGKVRGEGHDWSKDCEKCARCGAARPAAHKWTGCKCSACGKTREEEHDWGKDCEKCASCGATRDNAHQWSGCKCAECGKTRNEGHTWDGCKCKVCGMMRDEAHAWDGCKCSTCGKSRDEGHSWAENCERCSKCGKTQSQAHDWSLDTEKCAKCGMPNPKTLFSLGCKHLVSGESSEAIRYLELVARAGHCEAKNNLGVLLLERGDVRGANKWIWEAADEGSATAIKNRRQVEYYMHPPGPGAMARFEFSWGPDPPSRRPWV